MVNINLTTELEESHGGGSLGAGFSWVLVALVIVLIAYGGIFYYTRSVESQIAAVKASEADALTQLNSPGNKTAIGSQERVAVASLLINEPNPVKGIFALLENTLLPTVYVTAYSFDRQTGMIALSCVTDNLNTVAQQIYTFRVGKYDATHFYFSSVAVGPTSVDSTGKVSFSMSLGLNPSPTL